MKAEKKYRKKRLSPYFKPGISLLSWTRCENYYSFESRIRGDILSLHPGSFDYGAILWKEV